MTIPVSAGAIVSDGTKVKDECVHNWASASRRTGHQIANRQASPLSSVQNQLSGPSRSTTTKCSPLRNWDHSAAIVSTESKEIVTDRFDSITLQLHTGRLHRFPLGRIVTTESRPARRQPRMYTTFGCRHFNESRHPKFGLSNWRCGGSLVRQHTCLRSLLG